MLEHPEIAAKVDAYIAWHRESGNLDGISMLDCTPEQFRSAALHCVICNIERDIQRVTHQEATSTEVLEVLKAPANVSIPAKPVDERRIIINYFGDPFKFEDPLKDV